MAYFIQKGKFSFDKRQMQQFVSTVPILVANNTENHFREGFRKGGGQTDDSKNGWAARQFTKGKGSRNILVKTGTLMRDVLKKRVSFERIVVGTSAVTNKYADIHNSGGKIKVTEKMRKFFWAKYSESKDEEEKRYWKNLALTSKAFIEIPKREYIGDSKELEKANEVIIDKAMLKIFK